MRGGRFLLVVAVIAVIASAASAAAKQGFVISGDLHTSSARTVVGTNGACGFRPDHTLGYDSSAMRIGSGPTVARVGIVVRDFRGPGRYNAAARYSANATSLYQHTAVEVTTAENATTGVASSRYIATSGLLRVVRAKNVGRRGHWASLSGTVHANLRLTGTPNRLRLDGNWQCRIEPVANGVR